MEVLAHATHVNGWDPTGTEVLTQVTHVSGWDPVAYDMSQ